MKIDLHCHTKKVKTGDPVTRTVTKELFCQKIADADVKIVAITNHNDFDITQFRELKEAVKSYCKVWPGIELDIVDESKTRWHLIVVVNPKYQNEFYKKTVELLKDYNKDEISFEINTIISAFKNLDAIYIPHYHKDPEIPKIDLQKLYGTVTEEYRIFLETSNYRSLGVFANYQHKVIIGSDVKNWNKYEKSNFAELRLPIDSYEQFLMLAKRDIVNVETLLCKNTPIVVDVSPHSDVHLKIELYPEMNIIFGQKGTGKSEMLSSIKEYLSLHGKTCSIYRGTERDEDFKKILSTAGMKHSTQNLFISNGIEQFARIFEWKDIVPTSFSEYLVWQETKEKNRNKGLMRITNATRISIPNPTKYNETKTDRNNSLKLKETIRIIDIEKYLEQQETQQLIYLIDKLYDKTKREVVNQCIENEAIKLANFSIEKIKTYADKHSNTKSFPSTTGFYEYAVSRIDLKKNIETLINLLNTDPKYDSHYLGNLEEKGPVYVTSIYRMLCNESKTKEFSIGIRQLQDVKKKIDDIYKSIYDSTLQTYIEDFISLCNEYGINSLDPFVGTLKIITSDKKEEYKPSNGEKGILLLQKELSSEADAYLLDEPELGMGNSYIDNCIRPRLSELAKMKKYVVIATHNANLAVRTLPYQSIFRQYKYGNYDTYVGNPFTNLLVNINNPNDCLSWKEESMHTLEGGQEAFYEREYIYDTGSHQC